MESSRRRRSRVNRVRSATGMGSLFQTTVPLSPVDVWLLGRAVGDRPVFGLVSKENSLQGLIMFCLRNLLLYFELLAIKKKILLLLLL